MLQWVWRFLGAGLRSRHARVPRPGLEPRGNVNGDSLAMSLVCVEDFEQQAQLKLDRNAWNYYSSGANQEQTLRDNVDAYKR